MNLLIVGVGGQGVVLASNILAEAALKAGFEVKKTDSLGMAQRGGSVVSHLRWGRFVFSPLVRLGEADAVIAFEKLEGARWAHYLKPGGMMIMNDLAQPPLMVSSGNEKYPSDARIKEIVGDYSPDLHLVPAGKVARELGNPKLVNTILLGYADRFLGLPQGLLLRTIEENLPLKLGEINLKAFAAGAELSAQLPR